MEISVAKEMGQLPVTVFQLKGDLTNEEPLYSQVKDAYDAGARYLLLDLTAVPYISSYGLRTLHKVYMLLRGNTTGDTGGIAAGTYNSPHLKLYNPSPTALKSLSVAGYDMFLEIHKDYSEAIASFK
jgi:hypothetical protein